MRPRVRLVLSVAVALTLAVGAALPAGAMYGASSGGNQVPQLSGSGIDKGGYAPTGREQAAA